jgi:hypothetical protein
VSGIVVCICFCKALSKQEHRFCLKGFTVFVLNEGVYSDRVF